MASNINIDVSLREAGMCTSLANMANDFPSQLEIDVFADKACALKFACRLEMALDNGNVVKLERDTDSDDIGGTLSELVRMAELIDAAWEAQQPTAGAYARAQESPEPSADGEDVQGRPF